MQCAIKYANQPLVTQSKHLCIYPGGEWICKHKEDAKAKLYANRAHVIYNHQRNCCALDSPTISIH